jgi:hypothetical protein
LPTGFPLTVLASPPAFPGCVSLLLDPIIPIDLKSMPALPFRSHSFLWLIQKLEILCKGFYDKMRIEGYIHLFSKHNLIHGKPKDY